MGLKRNFIIFRSSTLEKSYLDVGEMMKMALFWNVAPWSLVDTDVSEELTPSAIKVMKIQKKKVQNCPRNVNHHLLDNMNPHPARQPYSYWPL